MVVSMSTTQLMTDQAKNDRSLPPAAIIAVLVVVALAVVIAAYVVFGPKPEPHVRYNSAELMHKAQKDINSLTPDERRVYDHITHADAAPPKFNAPPPAQTK